MKAILKDSKGWTKTLDVPYPMREIRIPLYRKTRFYYEQPQSTLIELDRGKEMVIFELVQQGLNDRTLYYDEIVDEYSGTSSQVSSPYDESNGGANPSTASTSAK